MVDLEVEVFHHNSIISEDVTVLILGFLTSDNLSVIHWLVKRLMIENIIDHGNYSEP